MLALTAEFFSTRSVICSNTQSACKWTTHTLEASHTHALDLLSIQKTEDEEEEEEKKHKPNLDKRKEMEKGIDQPK